MTKIFLVRHGENPANLTKEFSYKTIDYDLNDKGILQALQTAEYFSKYQIDGVYSSPLKRAIQTANQISSKIDKPFSIIEELREINVGYLENELPTEANWNIYFSILKEWFGGNYEKRFPKGENYLELIERFSKFLSEITKKHNRQNIVAVGHGGIFAIAIAELCKVNDKESFTIIQNHNCSISVIETELVNEELKVKVIEWANYSHLSGEAANIVDGLPYK